MKGVVLISGGIDSPVAAYIMMKKGVETIFVHFDNKPYTDEKQLNKTKKLVEILSKKFNKKIKLYLVNHGPNQTEFLKKTNHRYNCLLCRSLMYRVAEKIAIKEKADFLITGENLAQVASQTLDNLIVEDKSIKIPVLRPLLCHDKNDIIKIAKAIGTFETSILPGMCCSHIPKHPVTRAKKEEFEFELQKIEVDKLVEDSLKTLSSQDIE